MIHTTLNKIREHEPCTGSWNQLLVSLEKTKADDEPLSMAYILDTLGVADCLWAFRSIPKQANIARTFACDCAEHVLPIFEKKYPEDQRPRKCIEVAREFIAGNATAEDLKLARAASAAAAHAAAAASAAYAAAHAASAAAAAHAAHAASAAHAAHAAAYAAAHAAAAHAAYAAAAHAYERSWQKETLHKCLNEE